MRIRMCLALALAGTFSISAAIATTLAPMDVTKLAKEASVAIMGEVIATRSARIGTELKSIATVRVENTMWGTNAATVDVEVPGGRQQNGKFKLGAVVAGAPMLMKGERFILMLSRSTGSDNLTIVGFSQGALNVVRTSDGDAVMLPGAGRLQPVTQATRGIQAARTLEDSDRVLR